MVDVDAPARSPRKLVIAAVVLAVFGALMLWAGGGTDGSADPNAAASPQPTGQATGGISEAPQHGHPDDSTASPPPQATRSPGSEPPDGDTPTRTPTPPPSPTLPPGMQRPGPTKLPEPATINGKDPAAVATAVLIAAYAVDTAANVGRDETLRRIKPWLAYDLDHDDYDFATLEQDFTKNWDLWRAHHAYLSVNSIVDVTEDGAPPNTDTATYTQYVVNYTPLGRDGWTGNLAVNAFYVILKRESAADPWRITQLRLA